MTYLKYLASSLSLAAWAFAGGAHAGTITTTFASNNGFSGNMFDITTFANELLVTSIDVNLDTGATTDIQVYIKTGSYVGFETDASAWTLVSTTSSVASAGTNNATSVDVTDFLLPADELVGVYITATDSVINYTNGVNSYSNADLRIDTGVGIGNLFGSVFRPRTWNGTINYDVQAPAQAAVQTVSEPGMLGLLGLSFVGLATVRRARKA